MKRYGIIVEDVKTGKRISGVKVEVTDFTIHMDQSPIFDSGVTDELGLVYLDPIENMKKRKRRMDNINDMFHEEQIGQRLRSGCANKK